MDYKGFKVPFFQIQNFKVKKVFSYETMYIFFMKKTNEKKDDLL